MRVLHAGCGRAPLEFFNDYEEVRLDIDPLVEPDIVASLTDLGEIGPFDTIYCSHSVEHLKRQEVPVALREFLRVLKPGGLLLLIVPDLEDVPPTEDVLFVSPSGPITGLDLIYGKTEGAYMRHQSGFTRDTMIGALAKAGFAEVRSHRMRDHNLVSFAIKGGA